jgi:murein DD-endopeptidase MepM/ murein hydrolase activator NlpD
VRRFAARPTIVLLAATMTFAAAETSARNKGYDIHETGLTPRYPSSMSCPPLTSLYASLDDVDGTPRDEPHSGVDGGRLGDPILAPASGRVAALWQANWGWGEEQALLIAHTKKDLAISSPGAVEYLSEFDHLELGEPIGLKRGDSVVRGQRLATVFRPGGEKDYLPEVHWEVWEAPANSQLVWSRNKFGGWYWTIDAARLIDPLYMLSLNEKVRHDLAVDIHPYDSQRDYTHYAGFTYIFPCSPIAAGNGKSNSRTH